VKQLTLEDKATITCSVQ